MIIYSSAPIPTSYHKLQNADENEFVFAAAQRKSALESGWPIPCGFIVRHMGRDRNNKLAIFPVMCDVRTSTSV